MNQPQEPASRVPDLGAFRIDEWSVCPDEGTLATGGRTIRVEPRVMDVLVCLAAEPGRVVSKEELLKCVWGEAYVEEGVLSQAVHSLRKALGDDARQPRYIQTIPKRGYRLVAAVARESEPPVEVPVVPSPAPVVHPPPSRRPSWIWLALALAGVATVVAFWLFSREPAGEARSAPSLAEETGTALDAEAGTSIVVLPFQELTPPEDTILASGLTEEITKDLAALPTLRVIPRMTAEQYVREKRSLREIADELKVDYVLEGKVEWERRSGRSPRARIITSLIQVEDGAQVWADSFYPEIEDGVFEVQAQISKQVISQLGISLAPEEAQRAREQPTKNMDAYNAYLRGRVIRNQPFFSERHVRQAIPLFERAVELDEGFATAWAELSQSHAYLAFNADPSPARVEMARHALQRALDLAPELPETLVAQAYFSYRCLKDYETAETQLRAALRLSPNDPEVLQTLGFVLRRRGRMAQAIEELQRALWLAPKTTRLEWAIAETYRAMRNFEQAERYFAHATSIAPEQIPYWEDRAFNLLSWKGDVQAARDLLEGSPVREQPGLASAFFLLDFYDREHERALEHLTPENLRELAPQLRGQILTLAVTAREQLGDRNGALAAAEDNRRILEDQAERFPLDPFYPACLAVTLAQLGRQDEALAHMETALRIMRHDALTGPRIVEIQAMMEVILGRHQEAIRRLAGLLSQHYQGSVTIAELRLSPVWDPLRDDPAFQELLAAR